MITNTGDGVTGPAQHAASRDGARRSRNRWQTAQEGESRAPDGTFFYDRPDGQSGGISSDDFGEGFFDTVFNAARLSGCELLFEIPSALFHEPQGRAAAMRFGARADAELFFILFNAGNDAIRILEEGDVPAAVLDFTRSYAGVLGLIAVDKRLTALSLQ